MINAKNFEEYIAVIEEGRNFKTTPEATVIIVIYNSGEAVLDLLASLKDQTFSAFEIIIVNNGKIPSKVVETIIAEPVLYIESKRNSLSLGRNIGTAYAMAGIIVCLDDDCIAHRDLVKVHVESYRDSSVLGVQGKGHPNRYPFYDHFQSHYNLGPTVEPAVIGFEGNMSFRKRVLIETEGFDPDLFGGEGLDLSYRIIQRYKQPRGLIYNPDAIVFHDFAKGFFDYIEKCCRHPKMRNKLFRQNPRILQFAKGYGPYNKPQDTYSSLREKLAVKLVGLFGSAAELIGRYC